MQSRFKRRIYEAVKSTGYKGVILPTNQCNEGGEIISGKNFWLVSEELGETIRQGLSDSLGLEVYGIIPMFVKYPMRASDTGALVTQRYSHIDTMNGVLDDAKIIYSWYSLARPQQVADFLDSGKPISEFGPDEGLKILSAYMNNMETFHAIADNHGYQMRQYCDGDNSFWGINFITGSGTVFTTGIQRDEEIYLNKRDIEVFEFPLKHNSGSAGLRCYYGELLVPKFPLAQSMLILPS